MGIPVWMLGLGARVAKKIVAKKIVEKGFDYLTGMMILLKKKSMVLKN